jgi:dihydroxyacetone kinase-like protein
MRDVICISHLRRMFAEAAVQIRRNHEKLSQLDCIGGDGDHGATMLRTMEMLEGEMNAEDDRSLNARLKDAGWSVLGVGVAASLAAGLRAVEKQTKARPGDKTMMDALVPAVAAIESAANSGAPIAQALELASGAAHTSAEATKGMIARYGRARFLGEKTRGSADAGATSIALLFQGFSAALVPHKEA